MTTENNHREQSEHNNSMTAYNPKQETYILDIQVIIVVLCLSETTK